MSVFVSQRETITYMDKISCVNGRKWEVMTCNISPKWKRPGASCVPCWDYVVSSVFLTSSLFSNSGIRHPTNWRHWNLDNDVVPVLPRKKRRPLRHSSVRRRNTIKNRYEIPRRIIEWQKTRNNLRQTKYNLHQIKSKTDVPEESWQICSKHTGFPPQLQKVTACLYTGSANKNLESCKK